MAESSWDDIRKRARNLENNIDLKLVALSKISCSSSSSYGHGESAPLLSSEFSFETLSLEISEMVIKLSELNDKLASVNSTSSAQLHTQTRHRDILNSYKTEFQKIMQNHTIKIEREELLRDNESGMSLSSSSSNNLSNRRDQYQMKESQHIANSHNMINDQISIAIETQKSLKSQRKAFKKLQNRFNNLANSFPRINSLLQRINIKKRRDSLILGLVISACTILMLLYAFH